jgi:hypothetical protein
MSVDEEDVEVVNAVVVKAVWEVSCNHDHVVAVDDGEGCVKGCRL